MNDSEKIVRAFPNILEENVLSLLEKVSLKSEHNISHTFEVIIDRERVEIPYRIYFEEPKVENLNKTELLILNCLFTRHSDGFVRQRSLERILISDKYWITPFVLQLLGEYVREISVKIEVNFSDSLLNNLVRFIAENPKLFETIKSRIVSYWDCYYRNQFPIRENYVGFRILNKIITSAETKYPNVI